LSSQILNVTSSLIVVACHTAGNLHSSNDRIGSNGFLVRGGVALWLSVMRNLTEELYVCHKRELQQLFCSCLEGLHIANAETFAGGIENNFGRCNDKTSDGWNLFTETDSSEILTDLFLVVEAYALLGGELDNLLSDVHCRAALTALYAQTLGKVEPKLVQFVVRPLRALLISTPIHAGKYFHESGLLPCILRITNASVNCSKMQQLLAEYKESDLALLGYLTLVAELLLINPSALQASFDEFRTYVYSTLHSMNLQVNQQCLTNTIVLHEIVQLMFKLLDALLYYPAPKATSKIWCLALLSLLPPTVVENKLFIPPVDLANCPFALKDSYSNEHVCVVSRTMMMLKSILQPALSKLEEHICPNAAALASAVAAEKQNIDYSIACFWYPSTLSADNLFELVEPLVSACKGSLKDERSKNSTQKMLRQFVEMVRSSSESVGYDVGACYSDDDESDENEEGESSCDCDGEIENVFVSQEKTALNAKDGDTVLQNIVAAAALEFGDDTGGVLAVTNIFAEPIVEVFARRIKGVGILDASIERHLTIKLTQLCRIVGEQKFCSLSCIGDLHL
jgi:hypothetical protein